jgi:hypothetical protein
MPKTEHERELCRKARKQAFQDAIEHAQTHLDNELSKHYPGDFVARQIVEGLRALSAYETEEGSNGERN